MADGDQPKQTGCTEFLMYFEEQFKELGLEGLPLMKVAETVNKSDKKKPPPSNSTKSATV